MTASRILAAYALAICAATAAWAQADRQAYPVEMALPFGVATGKLVSSGEHLIFIDDQQPESSFAVNRSDVQSVEDRGGELTIQLARPVRDRSGERTRIIFRTQDSGVGAALTAWSRMPGPATAAAGAADRVTGQPSGAMSFQAQHDHRIGSCNGRLMISDDRIVFESVTDLDHSRQWSMRDVKELQRSSPYRIEIKPFTGNDYTLRLIGHGMDNEEYADLVRRVTRARATGQ